MSFFRILIILLLIPCSNLYAADFELDRGIGFTKGRDVEDWVSTKGQRSSQSGLGSNFNQKNSLIESSINASSYGNAIVIQTQPGGHVVLNASQINTGNQTSEINLKGLGEPEYKNVEVPSYNQDLNVQYSK